VADLGAAGEQAADAVLVHARLDRRGGQDGGAVAAERRENRSGSGSGGTDLPEASDDLGGGTSGPTGAAAVLKVTGVRFHDGVLSQGPASRVVLADRPGGFSCKAVCGSAYRLSRFRFTLDREAVNT